MIEKKGHNSDISEALDDIRLEYECGQAFVRHRFPKPSVEAEWEKFKSQVDGKAKVQLKPLRRELALRWLGAVMAAAIFMGAMFIITLDEQVTVESKPLVVLLEKTSDNTLKMIETDEVADKISEYELTTAELLEKKGAILSSKQADYTQVNEQPAQILVSIPRGQTYQITLNDGTEVWLNAGSRLSFPSSFIGDSRVVTLDGEAYFKVARDEKRPFIVSTSQIATHVLGTEFNMKAYEGLESHVTLVKGAVKVEIKDSQKEVLLYPGEDIACLHDGTCQVRQVDTTRYAQWLDGYFYFDDVCLKDILKELGYWYNLTIEAEDDARLMDMRLHFVAEHDDGIESVIEKLNMYDYLSVCQKDNSLVVCRK